MFCNFFKNFFIYSNELRTVKAEIRLNGGRLRGSLLYQKTFSFIDDLIHKEHVFQDY